MSRAALLVLVVIVSTLAACSPSMPASPRAEASLGLPSSGNASAQAPVYRMRETLDDPHVRASDILTEIDFPGIGTAPIAATPVKLHATPGEIRRRPPLLGEHNAEILGELEFTDAEITAFQKDGTV